MSAPMLQGMRIHFSQILNISQKICAQCMKRLKNIYKYPTITSSLGLSIAFCEKKETPLIPDSSSLSQASLIRNAASATVDSSSAVLSQVVTSVVDTEKQYKETVDALCELLELQLSTIGHGGPHEEQLWEEILEARANLAAIVKQQQELGILYSSVEKLMDATGEVSFFAGADYGVTCTGERLHSAEMFIQQAKSASKQATENLHLVEVKVIEVTTRKAEEEKKRLKAKEAAEKQNEENQSEESGES